MDLSHPESRLEKLLAILLKLSPEEYPYGVNSRIEAYLRYMIENGVPGTKSGYYWGGKFYKDSEHTEEIDPVEDGLYLDSVTKKLYTWNGVQYISISGGSGGSSSSEEIYYDPTIDPHAPNSVAEALADLFNSKTAEDITYDEDDTYSDGTVGKGIQSKEKKIYREEPENPQDEDLWIDKNDPGIFPRIMNAGSVTFDPNEAYPDGSVGKTLNQQSATIVDLQTAEGQTRDMISDAWTQRTWNAGEYCIDNNKLWKCLVTNSNRPSEGANWTEVTVGRELKNNRPQILYGTVKARSGQGVSNTHVAEITNCQAGTYIVTFYGRIDQVSTTNRIFIAINGFAEMSAGKINEYSAGFCLTKILPISENGTIYGSLYSENAFSNLEEVVLTAVRIGD